MGKTAVRSLHVLYVLTLNQYYVNYIIILYDYYSS